MGHLDQTRNNRRSNQPTPDTIRDKECEPDTPESLHISNTETAHLIYLSMENGTLLQLLLQVREKNTSTLYMNMTPNQYYQSS